jgi:hypothetical protein
MIDADAATIAIAERVNVTRLATIYRETSES